MEVEILPKNFRSWRDYDEFQKRYEDGLAELVDCLAKIKK